MKKGLIMEGGAMRGMFTCGIIDVFMEEGIEFDGAVGVSAGATFGCNLKSKQQGRALRYNVKYSRDPRYGTFRSWLKTGDMYEGKFCYETLPFKLDPFDIKAFENNPMAFYCVATDAITGKPVYHKCKTGTGEDMRWIRASASIPLASKMVKIGNGYFCDGGAADSIPLRFFEEKGYEKNVVILTRDRGFRKQPDNLAPLYPVLLAKYPGAAKSLATRTEMYNKERRYVEKREKQGKAFVIYPSAPIDIPRTEHDPHELKRIYYMGRDVAHAKLDELKEFLEG